MRKDPHGNQLLPCMYYKSGRYYYVKRNKWLPLSKVYSHAVRQWSDKEGEDSQWSDLVNLAYQDYERRHTKGDMADATWSQYRGIKPKLIHGLGLNQPHEITTGIVMQYLEQYAATPNMANRMLTVLKFVFDKGCRTGACDFNPTAGIKRFDEKKRDRYLTDDEFMRIRGKANPTTRVIMDLCYLTASRISDVLAIEHSHITPDTLWIRQGKTGKRQEHTMTDELKGVISDAKAIHAIQTLSPFLLHPIGKRTAYKYSGVKEAYRRACVAAGVKDTTLHDLRAKSLTDADRDGIDAQKLAGHSNPSMTERYLRLRRTDVVSGPSLRNLIDGRGETQ